MATSLGTADDVPPWAIDQQAIQDRLHARKLRRDPLPQGQIVPQCLRLNAADDALRLCLQVRTSMPTDWLRHAGQVHEYTPPRFLIV